MRSMALIIAQSFEHGDEPMDGNEEQKKLMKAALKEGIQEWLDKQFVQFGKWTLAALASAFLGAAVYLVLWSKGWVPK